MCTATVGALSLSQISHNDLLTLGMLDMMCHFFTSEFRKFAFLNLLRGGGIIVSSAVF